MTPAQYHEVLIGLDRALFVFKESETDVTNDDRKLELGIAKLRAKVLRAESGHPFPATDVLDEELDPETTRPPFPL